MSSRFFFEGGGKRAVEGEGTAVKMWQNGKGKCVLEKCKACNKTIATPLQEQQQRNRG